MSQSALPDVTPEPDSTTRDVTPGRRTAAWGVHLFTASGAVVGALALLATGAGDFQRAALLMALAFFIDSVDGTLARRVGVSWVLPKIDGRRLDDMVDYLNFVIVPVLFMVWAGGLLHWSLSAIPILASAYGFSNEDAKTEDNFFLGWPSYWNVVAIYVWLLDVSPLAGTFWVVLFSAAIFVPIKYVYPSKLAVMRRSTNLLGLVWGCLLIFCVLFQESARPLYLVELSLAYPVYYLLLSFWLGGYQRPEPADGD